MGFIVYYILNMRCIVFFALLVMVLVACNTIETEPKIVLGKEWNESAKVVADTTSQFKANDVIFIQMDNGKPFTANEVELRIYQHESNRILFKRPSPVKSTDAKLTIKGSDSKPLTAKDILRTSTPGAYRIAFAIGDSILLEKKLELIK